MPHEDEKYQKEEIARRRDDVIRRMANTPPQPKPTVPRRQTGKTTGEDHAAHKGHASREDETGT